MRLRTYILILFVSVVSLMVLGMAFEAKRILRMGFEELKANQLKRVTKNIKAIVKSKQENLDNFLPVLAKDRDLTKAFHFGIQADIDRRLEQVRKDSHFSFVDLIYPDGKASFWTHRIDAKLVYESALSGNVVHTVLAVGKRIVLARFAPIHDGQSRALLLVGYDLNEALETRISDLTGTEIKFILMSSPQKSVLGKDEYELLATSRWILAARITLDERILGSISTKLDWSFLALGAAGLVLTILLLFIFFDFGFYRPFLSILGSIDEAARDLDRGVLRDVPRPRYRIAENTLLGQAFHKFAASLLIYDRKAKEESRKLLEAERQGALATVARDVAHDMRGPLSSLDKLVKVCAGIPDEERGLIRNCIARAIGVAQALLSKSASVSETTESVSNEMVAELIDSIVLEKSVQYADRCGIRIVFELTQENYGLFASVKPFEFKRALANIIDNSVEAISQPNGEVRVSVDRENAHSLRIIVKDSGIGIPTEILPTLGEKGRTFGKKTGTGLGLYNAIVKLREWNGTLVIASGLDEGTEVTIRLPLSEPPTWFTPSIELRDETVLVVIDDDRTVHELWARRIEGIPIRQILTFQSTNQLESWFRDNYHCLSDVLYLCDQEFLNGAESGISVIQKLAIEAQSILVTGRAADAELRNECVLHGARLLSKRLASAAPIRFCGRQALVSRR